MDLKEIAHYHVVGNSTFSNILSYILLINVVSELCECTQMTCAMCNYAAHPLVLKWQIKQLYRYGLLGTVRELAVPWIKIGLWRHLIPLSSSNQQIKEKNGNHIASKKQTNEKKLWEEILYIWVKIKIRYEKMGGISKNKP